MQEAAKNPNYLEEENLDKFNELMEENIRGTDIALPQSRKPLKLMYRVAHLLANLDWVDFDLGSTPGWWPLL